MWKYLVAAAVVLIAVSHLRADDVSADSLAAKAAKAEDQVKMSLENGAAIVDVASPSGIGRATIELKKGPWPAAVVLRLHLNGLESLTASGGKLKLAGYVLSHSGNTQRVTLTEEGKEGERDAGTTIRVFDGQGKPAAGLPPAGGYFEIELPKVLLESQPKSLNIQWIDFYRG